MMNYINCKWSILSLLTLYRNVEGKCYYYYSGSYTHQYCYNPYLPALGATYGSLIVIGIVVSLIVWWCCTKKTNQQGLSFHSQPSYHFFKTVSIPVSYQSGNLQNQYGNQQSRFIAMAGVHGTQNPYSMIPLTPYGNPQGQTNTPGELPCASCHASENLPENIQSENTKPDSN